ncbi:MAG: Crp/Fnr family transcriptional regulator [Rhodospirillaceae bacterium]
MSKETATARDSLDPIGMLSEVTPEDRDQISKMCRWKRYEAGEQIIDRQSETRDVFFVVSGSVRVVIYSASGREVTLDDIQAGGFFGELAALDGAPRSASVMAVEPTQVACLPPESFLRVLRDHNSIAINVLNRLTAIVRAATDRIVDLSTLGANNRVQGEILRRATEAGIRDDGSALIKPIPVHSEVASRVSTTRETVARVFNDLARKGLLKREQGALVVVDVDALSIMVSEFSS